MDAVQRDSGGRVWRSAALAAVVFGSALGTMTIGAMTGAHAAPVEDEAASADVSIAVSPSTSGPYVDRSFDWILHVSNAGPSDAGSVLVTDLVPGSMTVLGVSSDAFECSAAGNSITCSAGGLSAGSSATIDIDVMVPPSGQPSTLTDAAGLSSSTADPDGSNNSSSASVQTVVVEVGVDAAPVDVATVDVATVDVATVAVAPVDVAPVVSTIDRAPTVRAAVVAPSTLPTTGSDNATTALVAASMLVLGGAMLSLRRSRRTGV